ncbi:MAG: hypothetical protein Q8P20_07960 [bacterium]|nr:hypothetical protein [bacterium]MDZ4227876.1 hypothetical protein [Candidatus Levybacteria bacterium]
MKNVKIVEVDTTKEDWMESNIIALTNDLDSLYSLLSKEELDTVTKIVNLELEIERGCNQ